LWPDLTFPEEADSRLLELWETCLRADEELKQIRERKPPSGCLWRELEWEAEVLAQRRKALEASLAIVVAKRELLEAAADAATFQFRSALLYRDVARLHRHGTGLIQEERELTLEQYYIRQRIQWTRRQEMEENYLLWTLARMLLRVEAKWDELDLKAEGYIARAAEELDEAKALSSRAEELLVKAESVAAIAETLGEEELLRGSRADLEDAFRLPRPDSDDLDPGCQGPV